MSQRPRLSVEQVRVVFVLGKRPSLVQEIGQWHRGPPPKRSQPRIVRGRGADVGVTSVEAREAIELRQSLVEPRGQPSEIEMKQAVYVLVVDDPKGVGIDSIGTYDVKAHQRVLLFPSMKIHTSELGSAVLPEFRH